MQPYGIRTQLFQTCVEKMERNGEGGVFLCFSFFPLLSFFFLEVCSEGLGRFRFWYLCSPSFPFFFPPHSSIDSCTSKIGVRLIARKRISRDFGLTVYVFFFPSLSLCGIFIRLVGQLYRKLLEILHKFEVLSLSLG